MDYSKEANIQSYTFKVKLVENTSKIAKVNIIYFLFIFVAVSALFVSFLFISSPVFWRSTDFYHPAFFIGFQQTLRSLGIALAVLSVPGIICIVFRFIYIFQMKAAFDEMSNTYPFLRASIKRASDFLLIGFFGEIITIFVVPLLGNLVAAIMVLYSFYAFDQIFKEMKSKGLYEGEENKLLFYSYLGLVVIFPLVGILTYILVSVFSYMILLIILATICMLILTVSTIMHILGFMKLAQNFKGIVVSPTAPGQPTPTPVVAYQPAKQIAAQESTVSLVQPPIEQQTDFKYCSNCGHKIEDHSRFCSNCGSTQ
ncbi:MAG: zinc-ribbon domain-containing protein [Asgard group archaeon]|nr:zinc-ribbon domain-containing protein [Asgard group archaeon]